MLSGEDSGKEELAGGQLAGGDVAGGRGERGRATLGRLPLCSATDGRAHEHLIEYHREKNVQKNGKTNQNGACSISPPPHTHTRRHTYIIYIHCHR